MILLNWLRQCYPYTFYDFNKLFFILNAGNKRQVSETLNTTD